MADKVGKLNVWLSLNNDDLAKGLQDSERKLKRFTRGLYKDFYNAGNAVTDFVGKAGLAAIGTAFGAATFAAYKLTSALKESVNEAFQSQDRFQKIARTIGETSANLVAFDQVAKLEGLDSGEKALLQFTRRLGEAQEGSGEAFKALQSVGLSASDLAKKAPTEAFYQVAQAIKNAGDRTKQLQTAYAIFGREGIEVIRMLDAGRDAFDAMKKEVLATGEALNQIDANKIEAANDATDRLKSVLSGIGTQIAVKLALPMASAADIFRDFLVENKNFGPQIEQGFEKGFNGAKQFLDLIQEMRIGIANMRVSMLKFLGNWYNAEENFKRGRDLLINVPKGIAKKGFQFMQDVFSPAAWKTLGTEGMFRKYTSFIKRGVIEGMAESFNASEERTAAGGGQGFYESLLKEARVEAKKLADLKKEMVFSKQIDTGTGNIGSVYKDYTQRLNELNARAAEASRKQTELAEAGRSAVSVNKELAASTDLVTKAVEDESAAFDFLIERRRTAFDGARDAFNEYLSAARDTATQVQNAFSNSFRGLEDTIVDFVQTGKFNFRDFANQVIGDLARIVAQKSIVAPLVEGLSGAIFGNASPLEMAGNAVVGSVVGAATGMNLGAPITVNVSGDNPDAYGTGRAVGKAAADAFRSNVLNIVQNEIRPRGILYR